MMLLVFTLDLLACSKSVRATQPGRANRQHAIIAGPMISNSLGKQSHRQQDNKMHK
jgi:hypothetical protein